MTKRTMGFVAVCVLGRLAFAGECEFPTAGGDLATGWTTPPGASDTVVVSQGGTYTLSADATFGNVAVTTGAAVTFDLRGVPARTLTLNSVKTNDVWNYPSQYGYGFAPLVNGAIDVALRGGTWNFAGVNHFYGAGSGQANTGGSLTISDGAVVTNVANFYYGEHSVGSTVMIDGARVHAVNLSNWATGSHNTLVVTNGGEMRLSGYFQTDREGGPGPTTGFNEIRVSGAGSVFEAKGTGDNAVGNAHQQGGLVATDRAVLKTSGRVAIGNTDAADDSYVIVANCATANVASVGVGAVKLAQRSRFEVRDGAYAEVGGKLEIGVGGDTSWCRTLVSNATLKVNGSFVYPSAWSSRSNEFWLVDGGRLEGVFETAAIDVGGSSFNVFGVRNATASFKSFLLGRTNGYGDNELRIVDGANVTNKEVSTIGQGTAGNGIVVSNATLSLPGVYVGSGGSCNRLRAEAATVHVMGSTSLILGNSATAVSNRLEILDGSCVDAANLYGVVVVGNEGSFNEALVADSCLTTGTFKVGKAAPAGFNRATFRRSTFATVDPSATLNQDPFGAGHDGVVTFDDTDWDLRDTYLRVAMTGSNNVLRLVGGSTVKAVSRTVSIGNSSLNSVNNEIYVGAGSTLDVIRLRFQCRDSRLVVSNGTVKVSDAGNGVDLAYRENDVCDFSSNNVLRVEGSSSILDSLGPLTFSRNARLEVSLPPEGYAAGFVPIRGKTVVFSDTSRIAVEGDEFYARTGGSVVLAEAVDSLSVPQAILDASLADMPARCRLWVENKKLRFRAPSRKATAVIVR